jgi:protein-S-isoprenylcysteine O-methyltransferase Ste14
VPTSDRASLPAAVGAFTALPLVVAFLIPIGLGLVDPWRGSWIPIGLAMVTVGVLVLVATVVAFFRSGRGTLAPWDPPRRLVRSGLFAWCRNPMYVGVLTTIAGWAITFRSPAVAAYLIATGVGFHVRTIGYEEPWAAKTFGDEWDDYVATVPRWIPRPPHRTSGH